MDCVWLWVVWSPSSLMIHLLIALPWTIRDDKDILVVEDSTISGGPLQIACSDLTLEVIKSDALLRPC